MPSPSARVGLYTAAASAICTLAMALDAALAIRHRHRQHWFPSSLVSLNTTTLTILSIATKLPLNLSSPMPSRSDQLAKLSGSALVNTTSLKESVKSYWLMAHTSSRTAGEVDDGRQAMWTAKETLAERRQAKDASR